MTEESSGKTMEIIVAEEIDMAGGVCRYLNNFWYRIPNSEKRTELEYVLVNLADSERTIIFDRVSSLKEIALLEMDRGCNSQEELEAKLRREYSEIYLSRSFAGFLDDVEGAIAVSGVDKEKLRKRVDLQMSPQKTFFSNEECGELFLPVYIELRKKGYWHRELTN